MSRALLCSEAKSMQANVDVAASAVKCAWELLRQHDRLRKNHVDHHFGLGMQGVALAGRGEDEIAGLDRQVVEAALARNDVDFLAVGEPDPGS
jgi:hypothetical protein